MIFLNILCFWRVFWWTHLTRFSHIIFPTILNTSLFLSLKITEILWLNLLIRLIFVWRFLPLNYSTFIFIEGLVIFVWYNLLLIWRYIILSIHSVYLFLLWHFLNSLSLILLFILQVLNSTRILIIWMSRIN